MLKLNASRFHCPVPILNNEKVAITKYKEKINDFLIS